MELATKEVSQWGWPVGKCFVDMHLLNLISKVASIVDLFCTDLLGIETLKEFEYCRRTESRERNSKDDSKPFAVIYRELHSKICTRWHVCLV